MKKKKEIHLKDVFRKALKERGVPKEDITEKIMDLCMQVVVDTGIDAMKDDAEAWFIREKLHPAHAVARGIELMNMMLSHLEDGTDVADAQWMRVTYAMGLVAVTQTAAQRQDLPMPPSAAYGMLWFYYCDVVTADLFPA